MPCLRTSASSSPGPTIPSNVEVDVEVEGDGDGSGSAVRVREEQEGGSVTVVMKEMEDTAGRSSYYDQVSRAHCHCLPDTA